MGEKKQGKNEVATVNYRENAGIEFSLVRFGSETDRKDLRFKAKLGICNYWKHY